MKIVVVVLILVVIAVIAFVLNARKTQSPVGKPCIGCGSPAKFGYSEHAEEFVHGLKPMCLKCLSAQLEKDYASYSGRAVVVQPAVGPPCYVFQPLKEWAAAFKESKVAGDVQVLLHAMDVKCHDCGQKAQYSWIESKGLTGDNFGDSLDNGFTATILQRNPKPISLCAKCCVARIAGNLEQKKLEYLDVCSPKGADDGFVVPMGY